VNGDVRIIPGTAGRRLAQRIVAYLNQWHSDDEVEYVQSDLDVQKFSNDNTFVRLMGSVREADVFLIQSSGFPVNDRLMELLIGIDACRRSSAGRINVVLPHFPYARSDKIDQPRIALTARLVADLLVAAGAHRVITMDLHADQIQGFFDIAVDHLKATNLLAAYVKEFFLQELTDKEMRDQWTVISPDAGAAKRAQAFANSLGLDLAVVLKQRRSNDDSSEIMHVIGTVENKNCIIFDDEIDTGGTLVNTINALRQNYNIREAIAVVTHGVFSGRGLKTLEEAPHLKAVIATDTLDIPQRGETRRIRYRQGEEFVEEDILITKIHECTVAGLFAEMIRAVHLGRSVAEVYANWQIEPKRFNIFEDAGIIS